MRHLTRIPQRAAPATSAATTSQVRNHDTVLEPYRVLVGVLHTRAELREVRLRSGRLDAYLFYMLIPLIAVIAVATVLA